MQRWKRIAAAGFIACAMAVVRAAAGTTLQIPGVTDVPGVSAIPCKSVANLPDGNSDAGAKRMHKPFIITKELDKATPLLLQAMNNKRHFPKVTVTANGITVELVNVLVTSIKTIPGGPETVTFDYADAVVSGSTARR